MSHETEVTVWLQQLVDQPEEAAQALWQEYFARLVVVAQRELRGRERVSAQYNRS